MISVATAHTADVDGAVLRAARILLDGVFYVLAGAASLELSGPLSCDWRDGDVW